MKQNLFSMKRILILFFVFGFVVDLMAQKVNLDTLDIDQLNLYHYKAVNMRKTGIILAFSSIGIVAASYIVGNKIADVPSDDEYDPNKNELKGS
jgi:uncharacterized membrane protein